MLTIYAWYGAAQVGLSLSKYFEIVPLVIFQWSVAIYGDLGLCNIPSDSWKHVLG